MLLDSQVIEQPGLIGEKSELALGRDRLFDQIVCADVNGAPRGWNDARQTAESRGFTRAIRPHQPHHFAWLHGERKVVYSDELTVKFGKAFDLNHGLVNDDEITLRRGISSC